MKKVKTLFLCSLILALPLSAFAQPAGKRFAKKALGPEASKAISIKHGLKADGNKTGLDTTKMKPAAEDVSGRQLWGYVERSQDGGQGKTVSGMYSLNTSAPAELELLVGTGKSSFARNGSMQQDGFFYGADADFSTFDDGYVILYGGRYDAQTWEKTDWGQWDYENPNMIALETAQAADGTVYGIFHTQDWSGYEWGTIDYKNWRRTSTIGTASQAYVALGITKENVLYGVAADGNLYSIDTSNGNETKIGATGLTLLDSEGKTYGQSGEIDQKDNTFFWAAVNSEGEKALYSVDLQTGQASKLGDMNDQVYSLSIPRLTVNDGAPAAATGLDVQIADGGNSGTLVFTAPSKTYGGQDLTGQSLSYKIYLGNQKVASGDNIQPGQTVTASLNDLPEGLAKFYVTTANSVGTSPKAAAEKWIGLDRPNAPTDVKLEIDRSGYVRLTWKAPAKGIHGGFVGNLTYNIYRIAKDNTYRIITENWQSEEFSEEVNIGDEDATFSYQVVAVNTRGQKSDAATSNSVNFSTGFDLPYFEPFKEKAALGKFTIINVNNDNSIWSWSKEFEAVRCNWGDNAALDDWLITPPLHFKKGQTYKIAYLVRGADAKNFTERMEVKLGAKASVDGMTHTLLPAQDITNDTFEEFTHTVKADSTFNAFIGFHAISKPMQFLLYVDSIAVDIVPESKAPDMPTDFITTPDAQGKAVIALGFKAPATAVDGTELTGISQIEVRRGNELIKSFLSPAPGQSLEYVDDGALEGKNVYSIIAYNDYGAGKKAVAVGFAGIDRPASPRPVSVADNGNTVTLSWNPVSSGVNGGVLGDRLGYVVTEIASDGYVGKQLDSLTTTSCTLNIRTDEGNQMLKQWGVFASNEVDQSDIAIASLVVGSPLGLPYEESFNAGAAQNFVWTSQQGVSIASDASSDNDNGCATFNGKLSNALLGLSKIAFPNADHPILSFAHKANKDSKATLKVYAYCPDGSRRLLKEIDYNAGNAADEWLTEKIDLVGLKSQRYVSIQFVYDGRQDVDRVCVDAVAVRNAFGNDLSMSMSAPEEVNRGSRCKVSVNVRNIGMEVAQNYKVVLSVNGNVYKEFDGKEIAPYSDASPYLVEIPVDIFSNEGSLNISANVDFSADQNPDNNKAEAVVLVNPSEASPVENVTGTCQDNQLSLNWQAPSNPTERTLDDFEQYTPWAISDIGNWTTVDQNGNKTYAIQNFPFPHDNDAYAFIVFNPGEANIYYPVWMPQSGSQMMVSFCSGPAQGSDVIPNTDHWLISPELPGVEQTVSFYAARPNDEGKPETVELLYSTLSANTSDFKKVRDAMVTKIPASAKDFEQIEFDIPEGAKYFAIRHTTKDGFALLVDDVRYTTQGSAPVSYNIYCDGKLIRQVGSDTLAYSTSLAEIGGARDIYKLSVTALYANGTESEPVECAVVNAIESVETSVHPVDIFTLNGVLVRANATNTKGLKKGVYVTSDNRKIVVK